jgi:glycosyltransferase involved in cell wall biosynthesis
VKIVFSTDTINRGGKERQLFVLTRSLLKKGVKITIITKHFSKDNYLEEYGLDQSIINIYNGRSLWNKFCDYRKIIKSEKPDLVISWDIQTSLFAMLFKKNKFIFINASVQHGIRLFRISHFLRTLICLLSPYIIANSFAGLRANNLTPGKRRYVLYNGIENKFINTYTETYLEEQKNKLIPGYNQSPGIIFVTTANLIPYKDYFTVLKALDKLKHEKSFYYFILGDGPMHERIVAAVKEYGLEKRVILTGKIENVKEYLFISDIMIHSSRGEGISNAILEGMYAGLPVIATNVGGIPETVFPGSSMLFPYKDHKTLYDCLVRAPEVFKDFDSQSSEYKNHLRKFSVETMVKKFEDILKEVIGNR